MSNITDILDYNIIGTITDTIDFSAFIAFETENSERDKLYIINRFPHNKSNNTIFKEFFAYYLDLNHSKDIANFFSSNESFYIVFKHVKSQCISERFEKEITTDSFETRYDLLNNILMKIENFSNMPLNSQIVLSNMNYIGIDSNNLVQITYNLQKISSQSKINSHTLFDNITAIIELLLYHEINSRVDNRFNIIVKKCTNYLYNSIPELIVDLKKAQKSPNNSGLKNKIKLYIKKNKKLVKRYSVIGGILIVVVGIIVMLNSLINDHSKNSKSDEEVLLGNTKYSVNSDETADTAITPFELSSNSSENHENNITLSPNADIISEDYIVQYGDTLESICKEYYGTESCIRAVESFNNISNAQLIAGLVIKLPDKTIILLM